MSTDSKHTPEPSIVRVYSDHPEWSTVRRWFDMRHDVLAGLFVCAYEVFTDGPPSSDPDLMSEIKAKHPGCVLVYA